MFEEHKGEKNKSILPHKVCMGGAYVNVTHPGVMVSILIPMKRFFADLTSETGGS